MLRRQHNYFMESFLKWLEGFDFVTELPPDKSTTPEMGKGGLSDDSSLPMNMRQPPITSAFQTFSMPGSRRTTRKSDKKLP